MVVERDPAQSSVSEILERVLDKGIVIDASIRVSVAGIEVVSIDARVVVASAQTYLRHAGAPAFTALAARPREEARWTPVPEGLPPFPGVPGADRPSLKTPGPGRRRGNRRGSDRRAADRRAAWDRRHGLGRRARNRRRANVPVTVERRAQPDRRADHRRSVFERRSGERRSTGEMRRIEPDRRFGERRGKR
jgi:hypothetical protein